MTYGDDLDGFGVVKDNDDNLRHVDCMSYIGITEEDEKWVHLRCDRCGHSEFVPCYKFYSERDPPPNFTYLKQSEQWYSLKHQGHL